MDIYILDQLCSIEIRKSFIILLILIIAQLLHCYCSHELSGWNWESNNQEEVIELIDLSKEQYCRSSRAKIILGLIKSGFINLSIK